MRKFNLNDPTRTLLIVEYTKSTAKYLSLINNSNINQNNWNIRKKRCNLNGVPIFFMFVLVLDILDFFFSISLSRTYMNIWLPYFHCRFSEVSYADESTFLPLCTSIHVYEAEKFEVCKKLCDKLDGIQENNSRKNRIEQNRTKCENIHFPFNLICLPDHINTARWVDGWMDGSVKKKIHAHKHAR